MMGSAIMAWRARPDSACCCCCWLSDAPFDWPCPPPRACVGDRPAGGEPLPPPVRPIRAVCGTCAR